MEDGYLHYLYNMFIIEQYRARSAEPLAAGKHTLEIDTTIEGPSKGGSVLLKVDGDVVGKAELQRTVPTAFSASETFDVGADLGSTVGLDYYDRRPFGFTGRIGTVKVRLK